MNSVFTLITAVVFFTAYFPPSDMAVKNRVMFINLQYYLVMKSTIGPLLRIVQYIRIVYEMVYFLIELGKYWAISQ